MNQATKPPRPRFPFWGTIAIPAGLLWGTALGAGAGGGNEPGEQPIDLGDSGLRPGGLPASGDRFGRFQIAVAVLDPRDEGLHRVVVDRRDGIELVVVATGAADGQAQKSPAERIHLLIDDVHLHLLLINLGQHLRAER